jgi:predicted enzyme related to lactoylglutathione lyase
MEKRGEKMSDAELKISSITIAINKLDRMVTFYNNVFNAGLKPFEAYGVQLYEGKLAGIKLVFCPNEISGVKAEQNRHQFSFAVPDLEETMKAVINSGGQKLDKVLEKEDEKVVAILDPDSNTIELIQKL